MIIETRAVGIEAPPFVIAEMSGITISPWSVLWKSWMPPHKLVHTH